LALQEDGGAQRPRLIEALETFALSHQRDDPVDALVEVGGAGQIADELQVLLKCCVTGDRHDRDRFIVGRQAGGAR